jgi:hypothetical protein
MLKLGLLYNKDRIPLKFVNFIYLKLSSTQETVNNTTLLK